MADCISREAAIKAIRDYAESRTFNSYFNGMRKAMEIVNDVPAADVKPVVRNKWWVYEGLISCMECSAEVEEMTPFCPYCGTDMRKEEKQC